MDSGSVPVVRYLNDVCSNPGWWWGFSVCQSDDHSIEVDWKEVNEDKWNILIDHLLLPI